MNLAHRMTRARIALPAVLMLLLLAALLAWLGGDREGVSRTAARDKIHGSGTVRNLPEEAPLDDAIPQEVAETRRGFVSPDANAQPLVRPENFLLQIITGTEKTPVPGAVVLAYAVDGEIDQA